MKVRIMSTWGALLFLALPLFSQTPYITGQILGTLRNDWPGCVGMHFTTGAKPLIISALGRWIVAGNNTVHNLILTDEAGTTLASPALDPTGATPGAFAYVSIAPIELAPNTKYRLYSQEFSAGDQWYNFDTVATTTADASILGSSYSAAEPSTSKCATLTDDAPMPGHLYGPLNFKYQTIQPGTINATSSLVSAQVLNQLYCAAKPLAGTPKRVQVYCYTSTVATWDTLIFNSVFPALSPFSVIPDVHDASHANAITWLFQPGAAGAVAWQVAINGTSSTGTF